jgi:hypothetical protein
MLYHIISELRFTIIIKSYKVMKDRNTNQIFRLLISFTYMN